jgi:hypothetical protein
VFREIRKLATDDTLDDDFALELICDVIARELP